MKRISGLLIGLALVAGLAALSGVLIAMTGAVAAGTLEQPASSGSSATVSTGTTQSYAKGVIDIVLGETITISGGTLVTLGSNARGDGGLDAMGALKVTGGSVVACGDSTAAPSSDSTQPSVYVATGSVQPAGTVVTVTRDGEEILTITPDQEFQNVLVSSSRLITGAVYQVYLNSTGAAVSVTAAITPDGAVVQP